MVATGYQIIHQQDFKADIELEIMVGADRVVRINIDGICALRARLNKDAVLIYRNYSPNQVQNEAANE